MSFRHCGDLPGITKTRNCWPDRGVHWHVAGEAGQIKGQHHLYKAHPRCISSAIVWLSYRLDKLELMEQGANDVNTTTLPQLQGLAKQSVDLQTWQYAVMQTYERIFTIKPGPISPVASLRYKTLSDLWEFLRVVKGCRQFGSAPRSASEKLSSGQPKRPPTKKEADRQVNFAKKENKWNNSLDSRQRQLPRQ